MEPYHCRSSCGVVVRRRLPVLPLPDWSLGLVFQCLSDFAFTFVRTLHASRSDCSRAAWCTPVVGTPHTRRRAPQPPSGLWHTCRRPEGLDPTGFSPLRQTQAWRQQRPVYQPVRRFRSSSVVSSPPLGMWGDDAPITLPGTARLPHLGVGEDGLVVLPPCHRRRRGRPRLARHSVPAQP